MTLDDFLGGLDRYGGDLDAWPERERGEARAMTTGDPAADAAWRAQAEVEAWLSASRTAPSATPPAWIGEVARLPQRPGAMAAAGRRRALALAAAVACLAVGVTVGAAPHFAPEPSDVLMQALGGTAGVFDVG